MPDIEYVCGCVVFMARTCDSLKGTEIHVTYHAIRINMFLNNWPVLQCLNLHLCKCEEVLSSCPSFSFPQPTDLTVTCLLGEVLRSDSECFTKDKDFIFILPHSLSYTRFAVNFILIILHTHTHTHTKKNQCNTDKKSSLLNTDALK